MRGAAHGSDVLRRAACLSLATRARTSGLAHALGELLGGERQAHIEEGTCGGGGQGQRKRRHPSSPSLCVHTGHGSEFSAVLHANDARC